MKRRYTVFFVFHLKEHMFYLYINFIDIVFNNFSMDPTKPDFQMERYLTQTINFLNRFLILFAIACFFVYIYLESCKTVTHKVYIMVRILLVFLRLVVYSIILFYLIVKIV